VRHDQRFERPAEVDLLMGDASKAHSTLGWKPKVSFDQLVRRMYENDLNEESARSR
jgi:GDPmannose 4,6-dehydratase